MRTCLLSAVALVVPALVAHPVCQVWAEDGAPAHLQSPSVGAPREWLTEAEATGFGRTPRYDQTIAYCRRLADASEWIELQSFGTSPEGRDMAVLVASSDGTFTSTSARTSGKLIVLIQNCIHAGECAGKDASLMLLRDIAITRTRANLLDHVILLVIPIFNLDGHERFSPYSRINQNGPEEMGWRVTSRNLNLNRDYMKADAVEMRAWLKLWNEWRPHLHFDNHATDGGDWQYDLMYSADTHPAAAPQIAKWLRDDLYPHVLPAMDRDGHLTMEYFWLVDSKDPTKGIRSGGFGPRYSTGYVSVRNRPSILVESHMLKPYRTRVIGHYNIMRHSLEFLNQEPHTLRNATAEADLAAAAIGSRYDPDRRLPLAIGRTEEHHPITFKGYEFRRELSEISGDVRILYDNTTPMDFETVWYNGANVERDVTPPLAYIIPAQWTEAIELSQAHGLRCERLTEPLTDEFESYRFVDVSFPSRSYEGRFLPRFGVEPIVERRTYRPGSVIIPLDQPDAKVAVHLFEPEAPDSLASWGFFDAIFEQKEYAEHYVAEELAREMLEADPKLREEFEAKIRTDRDFASSPRARLHFFYKRSPYWDARMNIYPIGRVTKPLRVATEPLGSTH